MEKIVRNRIRCMRCNDIIESMYCHDFKWCKCKTVFVDGGHDYWKCGGKLEYILRIWDDGRETPLALKDDEEVDVKDLDSEPIDINDLLFYNVRSN